MHEIIGLVLSDKADELLQFPLSQIDTFVASISNVSESFALIFKQKIQKVSWEYSNNMLKGDGFEYYKDDFNMDAPHLTGNIRTLYIEFNNSKTNSAIVLQNVHKLTIHYPTADLYTYDRFVHTFPLENAVNAKHVWLLSYRGVIRGILPNVIGLVIKDCNLTQIELNAQLEDLRVYGTKFVGIEDLVAVLQSRPPLKKQVWENRPAAVLLTLIAKSDELYDIKTEGLKLYYHKTPRRLCGSNWVNISYLLRGIKEKRFSCEHIYIDGRDFDAATLATIIPTIDGITVKSIKIATTNLEYYKDTVEALTTTNPYEIVEAIYYDTEKKEEIVEQFYYNKETGYMLTYDYNTFDRFARNVKYLTLHSTTLSEMAQVQVGRFHAQCGVLQFLQINSINAEPNAIIDPLLLIKGSFISNKYMDILRDDRNKHSEVILKKYDKHFGNFESIHVGDESYRFVIEPSFLFKNFRLQPLLLLIGRLKAAKYIEFVGKLELLCKIIKSEDRNIRFAREQFAEMKALVGMRVQDDQNLLSVYTDFIDFTSSCSTLRYFTASFFSNVLLLKSSVAAIPQQFSTFDDSAWIHLEFAGYPLTSTFVFAKRKNTALTQETMRQEQNELSQMTKLFERPSIKEGLKDLFNEIKPTCKEEL